MREGRNMAKKKPNVVFVLTDDQGYGDLCCTGNPVIQTPNIDAMYEESTHFTNFHVGPTCAPSRSGLLTGHYANSTGVWHTVGGRSLLRENEWTLAAALKEGGYHTGIFGKWHLGDMKPYRPCDRGFDISIVHGGGGISQTPDYWGNDYFDDTYFVNGVPQKFEGYCTDVFFREAKKFITEHKEEPFFCYVAPNAPHTPYNVEEKYVEKYRELVPEARARFYGMIENIDENVGELQAFLQAEGLLDDTIFIFMTDNGTGGGATLDADSFVTDGYNANMRGAKCSEYDGGHRVPFFLYWKNGGIAQKQDINMITANVDFMPTILDLCGVETRSDVTFHGVSLKPWLLGEKSEEDRVIVTDSQRVCTPIKWRKSAVCSNEWRLVNGKELYQIQSDPEQRNDVAILHPEIVADLREHYEDWWKLVSTQFGEPIPIHLGKEETFFTSHDAMSANSATAWNQRQIRQGTLCVGHYEVEIEQTGIYQIELRRWTREVDAPISGIINPDEDISFAKDCVMESDWSFYSGSQSIPITGVTLKMQDQAYSKLVEATDTHVTFEVELEKGPAHLEATFVGEDNNVFVVPYYVYAKMI